jgi:hypothetical protein
MGIVTSFAFRDDPLRSYVLISFLGETMEISYRGPFFTHEGGLSHIVGTRSVRFRNAMKGTWDCSGRL